MKYPTTLIALLALTGCDKITNIAMEQLNAGNTTGVLYCMKDLRSAIVDETTAKNICASKHQVWINAELTGRAKYLEYGQLSFNGTLKNTTQEYIISEVILEVNIIDSATIANAGFTERYAIPHLWILPNKEGEFAQASPNSSKLHTVSLVVDNSNYQWRIINIAGVLVK